MSFNKVTYKTTRSNGKIYMKSGVKKNKLLKIHSPLALFQSDQQACTEVAIVDQAQSTVPIVVNKHQFQALRSNPNANISLTNKKRKKLLKRLRHAGLISSTNKANMMAVEIARPTNPFHFDFTSIVPIESETGTIIGPCC